MKRRHGEIPAATEFRAVIEELVCAAGITDGMLEQWGERCPGP